MRKFAELITRGCGWKVLVSEGAADKRVEFYLENIQVEEALRAVCSSYGLWYKRNQGSNVVQIMTLDEFRKGVNLYADELVEVITIKYPTVEEVGNTLQRLFQDRVIWNPPAEGENDPYDKMDRALKRMDLIADRATFADSDSSSSSTSNSSSSTSSSSTSSTSTTRAGNTSQPTNNSNRTGSMNGQPDLESTVTRQGKALDALQRSLSEADLQRIAGDGMPAHRPGLVYLSALTASNDLVLRSSDPISLKRVRDVALQLDKPLPQVLLEVKVLDVTLDDYHARGIDWLFLNGRSSGGWSRGINDAVGQNIQQTSPDFNLVPQGDGINTSAAIFNFVSEDIRARIQFLEEKNKTASLATPNLLVADNEASRVFIGTETTILEKVESSTTYTTGDNPVATTSYDVTAPRRKLGTTLVITPKIHADRSVTIRVLQEDSSAGEPKDIVYGTAGESFKSQDVNERSVATTVVARDGNLIAIGGLIRESSDKDVTGMPGIYKVPGIGELFKRTIKQQVRTELIILIRPYVLLAPGEGENASMNMLKRTSIHPSANVDTPSLGVGERKDVPLGDEGAAHKRKMERLKKQSPVMDVEP